MKTQFQATIGILPNESFPFFHHLCIDSRNCECNSRGALFIIFSVEHFFAAHRTNALFVCTRLTIVRSNLMHFLSTNPVENKKNRLKTSRKLIR